MEKPQSLPDVERDTLRAVLNAVGEGITVQGRDGRLVWANQAAAELSGFESAEELLAATPSEILGRFRLYDGTGDAAMDISELPGRRALSGENPPEVLVRWVNRRTGRQRWSLVRATPVMDGEGRVLYAVNVFRDVTERQLALQELEQSERRYARLYEERALAAKTLSEALVPADLPLIAGLELNASLRTASEGVGGDFYDVVRLRGGRWLLVIADVSGKGAQAAALTSMARYTLRTLARVHDRPSVLLEAVNEALTEDFPEGKFCSMAVAAVELKDRGAELTIVVAGHPLPVMVRSSGDVSSAGRTGLPLGAFDPLELVEEQVALGVGDTLVMFTDGCVGEGADSAKVLAPTLSSVAEAPLPELTRAVQEFAAKLHAERPDDSAVLAVRPV